MFKKFLKKALPLLITAAITLSSTVQPFAYVDNFILNDTVINTYSGRTEASSIASAVNFTDVPATHYGREAITRIAALGVVTGNNRMFRPDAVVSKEEALTYVLKSMALEGAAQAEAEKLLPLATTAQSWSLGYLKVAFDDGMISEQDLADAQADQSTLIPGASFYRGSAANREQVAQWVGQALIENSDFSLPTAYAKIYGVSDWGSIDVARLPYVELIMGLGIMNPVNGAFMPKANVSRAQMAQIIKNMGELSLAPRNLAKKTGTVGAIVKSVSNATGTAALTQSVYIRTADGGVDTLVYELKSDSSPLPKDKDIVVYKNNTITGVGALTEGDQLEYIVDDSNNIVLYAQVTNALSKKTARAFYKRIDVEARRIYVQDETSMGTEFSYPLVAGILSVEQSKNMVVVDGHKQDIATLKTGSVLELTLNNDVVSEIKYVGEPTITNQIQGVVMENNVDLGYLTIYDKNGTQITKNYYQNEMKVLKQQYYDLDDEVGYFEEMFPSFKYNPRESTIDQIEPGDIVYIRPDPTDNDIIAEISAVTNYSMRYGKVRQITRNEAGAEVLLEYESKLTSWLDITGGVFVSEDGRPSSLENIQPGDWIRVLVNEAVVEPGYVIESVKEIAVEGNEHFIENIYRGQLAGINQVQKTMSVQNSQKLIKTGWGEYRQLQQLDISGNDIEYYNDGARIPVDYALRYYNHGGAEVYIATEKNYDGERIKKVTFRQERDEVLAPDMIVSSDGAGHFRLLTSETDIMSDAGTIVRRYGRLVDGQNIMVPDYARVVLNGENRAAVVDIDDEPDTSGVQLVRGRVISVDDGKSFQVHSMYILRDMKWIPTPVSRSFAIDYNTKFYDASGTLMDPELFTGYGTGTQVDSFFTIMTDGTRAERVIDNAWAVNGTRGIINSVNGNTIELRNVYSYDDETGRWTLAGTTLTANVVPAGSALIIKNNRVVNVSSLQKGDQLRVMTNTLPDRITQGSTIDGLIIFVEN